MRKKSIGSILIECPNTVFEIFMENIRTVNHLGINDIYNWCNRQGISYDTRFNYNKELSIGKTIKAYCYYQRQKMKYKVGFGLG